MRDLPETVDESTDERYRFTVQGRQFAWTYPERVVEGKPKVLNKAVLVILCSPSDQEALIGSNPDVFFTTPHYGYGTGCVLVRYKEVDAAEMRELLTDSWRIRASATLRKAFDASAGISR